ncbi:MAG: helix-turn-helix domain-containing protein [Thauera sp.]
MTELAERMHTTQSTIARLESGRTMPSMRTLARYAEATGSRAVVRLERNAWPNSEGSTMTRMHNPPHPGETLREDVLPALPLTVTEAAAQCDGSENDSDRQLCAAFETTPCRP